jgi:hypothetical protein
MRRAAGVACLLVILAVAVTFLSRNAAGQRVAGHALTLRQIEDMVSFGVPDSTVHAEIQKRGLAFIPDPALLASLRAKGAGSMTLADIKALIPKAGRSNIDLTALDPQGYVSDFAGVVDPASRQQLENYCANLERLTGAQLALVAVPSLRGAPVDEFALALFRKWGIGHKGKDDGVLLLLAIEDRLSRLLPGYGLEPIISGGFAGDVLGAMRPNLRAGRYGDALVQAAHTIGTRIAQAKRVMLQTPVP